MTCRRSAVSALPSFNDAMPMHFLISTLLQVLVKLECMRELDDSNSNVEKESPITWSRRLVRRSAGVKSCPSMWPIVRTAVPASTQPRLKHAHALSRHTAADAVRYGTGLAV